MAIPPGTRIGPYEVLSLLGRGGMGEVYRATDPRLRRDVAIKVLPEAMGAGRARGARFEREARLLASINHPNIATIHGLEEHDGTGAIVMELVDGPSLVDLIARGPMALAESARIATQIAEGLTSAHARGIIHRDLKPANVRIASDGRVKILDLGLAKMMSPDDPTAGDSDETRSMAASIEGTVVGTAAYMSPEQAAGARVDQRTDVWAFGAVLFEMLSGRRAFAGRSSAETLSAVLQAQVDWQALPPTVPRPVRHLLERCLVRDATARLSDLGEALAVLHPTHGAFDQSEASTAQRSLLVLPFSNLSPDPDNEYFSDGLTEEVIADLSKLEALRVISRSTALRFKGAARDAAAAARAVDVRYVLDGSVRKAGANVRVVVELVDMASDTPLWAEKYSGTLDDVFEIQERISRAIADALRVRLSVEEERVLHARPASSGFAFDTYLRARRDIISFDRAALDRARTLVERALAVAPDEVLLLRAQAMIEWQEMNAGFTRDPAYLDRAEALAHRIIELDPTGPHGQTVLGYIAVQRGDPRNWVREFRRAAEADPSDPDSLVWLALGWTQVGHLDQARAVADRLERIDPLFDWLYFVRGLCEQFEGRFHAAIQCFRRCAELEPTMIGWYMMIVQAAASAGEIDVAARAMADAPSELADHPLAGLANALVAAVRGDRHTVERIFTDDFLERMAGDLQYAHVVAQTYSALGDVDEGLRWLDTSTTRGFINYPFLSTIDPLLQSLRGDPRFAQLMERVRHEWETFEESAR